MDAVAPSWYPDPQRDGMLRWWDGTRWTEHVQPGRVAGKPVLGQEVTGRAGPVTFYGPGEQVTHAFPPITDERYAGSPLAEALAQHVRADRSGGDVQIPAEHHAAVEAAYQLRKRGGLLGKVAGIGEQLVAESIADKRGTDASASGWMQGTGTGSTAPGMQTPSGQAGYRMAGSAVRAVAIGRLVATICLSVLLVVGGVVLAVVFPPALPFALGMVGIGVVLVGLIVWDLVRRPEPGRW